MKQQRFTTWAQFHIKKKLDTEKGVYKHIYKYGRMDDTTEQAERKDETEIKRYIMNANSVYLWMSRLCEPTRKTECV